MSAEDDGSAPGRAALLIDRATRIVRRNAWMTAFAWRE